MTGGVNYLLADLNSLSSRATAIVISPTHTLNQIDVLMNTKIYLFNFPSFVQDVFAFHFSILEMSELKLLKHSKSSVF